MFSFISRILRRATRPDEGPGSIAYEYRNIWAGYLYSIPLPFVFILLKLNNIELMSLDRARLTLERISYVDPVVAQHLSLLERLGRTTDIANYPAFIAVTFLFLCIPIAHGCWIYFRRWRVMLPPHPVVPFVIGVISSLYYVLEIQGFGSASENFHSIYHVYFDSRGLYYFPQAALFFVYAAGLLVFVLAALHTLSAILRRIRAESVSPRDLK